MLNSKLLGKLDALQTKLQSSINFFQFGYYRKISKNLYDPSFSLKCYWTLLKTLLSKDSFNLSLTSKKKVKSLTPSLQNSVH